MVPVGAGGSRAETAASGPDETDVGVSTATEDADDDADDGSPTVDDDCETDGADDTDDDVASPEVDPSPAGDGGVVAAGAGA